MKSAGRRLTFENGGEFIVETRREVELYLRSPGVGLRARSQLFAKAVVAFALWAVSWGAIVVARPGVALGLVCLGGLVLGTILIGFCVQHDANHGAYFRSRRFNHLLGWTADALLGFSSYAWRVKHNVAHHTYTNVDGYDDDLNQTPFMRLMPTQAPRPWYRVQHIYIWPLYSLMVLRWQTGADVAALIRGRVGGSTLHRPRRWDLVGLIAGKAVFAGWAIVLPLFFYPWWVVVAGYLGFTMVTSLVTATTFQLAHCVEEADFANLPAVVTRLASCREGEVVHVRPDRADDDDVVAGLDQDLAGQHDRAHARAGDHDALGADRLLVQPRQIFGDRPAQCAQIRRPLHRPTHASQCAPLAPAPSPCAWPAGPARRARDGLSPQPREEARRAARPSSVLVRGHSARTVSSATLTNRQAP